MPTSDDDTNALDSIETESKLKKYKNCIVRINDAIDKIKKDKWNKSQKIHELKTTILLMEQLLSYPNFLQEDDIINKVETEVLPKEIRDWLASTFTTSGKGKRSFEIPTFKAVVNAILASIMVEKIFKKSTDTAALKIPPNVHKVLELNTNLWDFDIFGYAELAKPHALRYLVIYLFLEHEFLKRYKISFELLENFLTGLEEGYESTKNEFDNSLHACDVTQTVHYFVSHYKLSGWMTDLQIFSMIFTAIVHAFRDPGLTNPFLIKIGHPFALLYNDQNVRENHNISMVFRLINNSTTNFLKGMSKDEYTEFRRLVIDNAFNMNLNGHVHMLRHMRSELAVGVELDKGKVTHFLLHAADLSHPTKDSQLHLKWTDMWSKQYMRQGELEKQMNIPYSPLCNPDTHGQHDIQATFIIYIIEPMFQVLGKLFETIERQIEEGNQKNAAKKDDENEGTHKKHPLPTQVFPWENRMYINKNMWQKRSLITAK